MKKILLTLCLCLLLALSLSSVALAAQSETLVAEASAQSDTQEGEAAPPPGTAEAEAAEENFFLSLYGQLSAHLPELFSALSLLGACIIGFCYKKGLLPILKDGIGAIGAATKEWGKTAESYAIEAKNICENANNSIHFVESCIEKIQDSLASVEERIAALGDQKTESEILRELMRGQVDMLYNIFLSSSLPQFEKDRVSLRVEEMRQLLEAQSGGDGDAEN